MNLITIPDWKAQQMIKASGWPLKPEDLFPGVDFNAQLDGGLVPLHWACDLGKAGLVKYMIEQGADVRDHADGVHGVLGLAARSGNFQTVMLLIDRLKALEVAQPDKAMAQLLTQAFSAGHPSSKNRLQQTLKDWARIQKTAAQKGV